jgi:uncharacterized protein YgbK (DUF1537 family)
MITLGVIADDFTGATDAASMLVRAGMRTVQLIGVPDAKQPVPAADAIVVGLKTRTVPVADATAESLAALRWLQRAGMRQCYFKYCSTFDSTPAGNIGPVTEALMNALGTDFTLACPAFPENGRTIFRGHLFVGDELLSDSGMRNHPLTPMHDANLVRVMQAQCRERRVGLIRHDTVAQGAAAVQARVDALRGDGVSIAIADAIDNDALRTLAAACADWPLLTAGSGLALGLPAMYEQRGWIRPDAAAARLDPLGGHAAVLSGSCSQATLAQVKTWQDAGRPAFAIDPRALARGEAVADEAAAWAAERVAREPVLVYASATPDTLRSVQAELGAAQAGELVERCVAQIARALVERGVQRLVVAGGETSGAVVNALGVTQLRIGAPICPGVPWTQAEGRSLQLALKSGNFGGPAFFAEALAIEPSR